jgi:hypothetical protein
MLRSLGMREEMLRMGKAAGCESCCAAAVLLAVLGAGSWGTRRPRMRFRSWSKMAVQVPSVMRVLPAAITSDPA